MMDENHSFFWNFVTNFQSDKKLRKSRIISNVIVNLFNISSILIESIYTEIFDTSIPKLQWMKWFCTMYMSHFRCWHLSNIFWYLITKSIRHVWMNKVKQIFFKIIWWKLEGILKQISVLMKVYIFYNTRYHAFLTTVLNKCKTSI